MIVSMTVWNRPQYLKPVLATWARAMQFTGPHHFIFNIEPGRFKEAREAQQLCAEWEVPGVSKELVYNETRYGNCTNTFFAMDRALEYDDFAVVAEDDVMVADDVTEYFDFVRVAGQEHRRLLAACAFRFGRRDLCCKDTAHIATRTMFYPTIWGTWRHWWEELQLGWDWDGDLRGGWDSVVKDFIDDRGLAVTTPCVSRAQHIGEVGIHVGQEVAVDTFAMTQSLTFQHEPSWERRGAWRMDWQG